MRTLSDMGEIALRSEGLGKRYRIGTTAGYGRLTESVAGAFSAAVRRLKRGTATASSDTSERTFWALRDLDLEVYEGDVLGIIGRNGAGKTTLLKILSRITAPTVGEAEVNGRLASLLEVGTGFHPELTGRENIYLNGAILGMQRSDIRARFDDIVEFSEVQRFLDTPVKRYSSGMYVRLAFAVAAHLEPEVLVVDEVLAVGDAAFQRKCLGKMENVAAEGRTVLFVSHNMAAITNLCQTGILLDRGRMIASGPIDSVVDHYLGTIDDAHEDTLERRVDREGDGRLRFVNVGFNGKATGVMRAGQPATIGLHYEAKPPLRNVDVSLAFYSSFGEGILHLSNAVSGDPLDDIPPRGELRCVFDKLPLMPGTYSLNIYCSVNGVLADWVKDAARVQVVEGDFYGTGRLPPPGYGSVLVEHRWDAHGA